jgi:hypothetical protein
MQKVQDHRNASGFCQCCGVPFPCSSVRRATASPATPASGLAVSERPPAASPGERSHSAERAQRTEWTHLPDSTVLLPESLLLQR